MKDEIKNIHLYESPYYTQNGRDWSECFWGAIDQADEPLHWDVSSILSIMSLNYTCGNRTLVEEVSRSPWLSSFDASGQVYQEPIPPHGTTRVKPEAFAAKMLELLTAEAITACQGKAEIYVLLSGGLDSRIIAGVLHRAYEAGAIKVKPVALSWGLENSRDVQYARKVAGFLGFEFQHIQMSPEDVYRNVVEGSKEIACLVPPNHLHCMSWLKNLSEDSIVIAGSYGDSIGRAEFSSQHLLELDYQKPKNIFGILKKDLLGVAVSGLEQDFRDLKDRAGNVEKYIYCEHQAQGIYMRNMIAHAMDVINGYSNLYQMFTAPSVYQYVWSLHPVYRDNQMYANLLELLHPSLARMPWARTNKALKGKTLWADKSLTKEFHTYQDWIKGPLYGDIKKLVDPDWFEATGIFDAENVRELSHAIKVGDPSYEKYRMRAYEIWLWLASFRIFAQELESRSKVVSLDVDIGECCSGNSAPEFNDRSKLRRRMSEIKPLYNIVSKVRKSYLKREALRKW